MSQNAQSIQTLLDAEKEASKIVTKSRQYRVQRLKDAQVEAAKDVQSLKNQRHADYVAAESNHKKQATDTSDIDLETEKKIQSLKSQYETTKGKALEEVIKALTTVHVEKHRNALLHKQRISIDK